jgi:hypothetical protein
MNWNRILSAMVCVFYGVVAFLHVGAIGITQTIGLVIFPLGFIWYADDIGSYVGSTFSGFINNSSPGWLICILGWLLLLLPIIVVMIESR